MAAVTQPEPDFGHYHSCVTAAILDAILEFAHNQNGPQCTQPEWPIAHNQNGPPTRTATQPERPPGYMGIYGSKVKVGWMGVRWYHVVLLLCRVTLHDSASQHHQSFTPVNFPYKYLHVAAQAALFA